MRSTALVLTDPTGATIPMVVGDEDFRGEFVCDTFTGLPGGVKIRSARGSNVGPGSTYPRIFRDPRDITLAGWVRYDPTLSGSAEVLRKASELTALWPDATRTGTLDFSWQGISYRAYVQPDDQFPILDTSRHYQGILRWRLPLIAPDPYFYGSEKNSDAPDTSFGIGLLYALFADGDNVNTGVLEFGSDIENPQAGSLVNEGNATAYPKFVVYGDAPSRFRITAGDLAVTWVGVVDPTAPVEVDSLRGTVTVGGVDRSEDLTEAVWAGVPPKGNITHAFAVQGLGYGSAAMILRDTYI